MWELAGPAEDAMSEQHLRLDEYEEQALGWLRSHGPHLMTDPPCVACQMATNVQLMVRALRLVDNEAFIGRVLEQLEEPA